MKDALIVGMMRSPIAKIRRVDGKSVVSTLTPQEFSRQVLRQLFIMNLINPIWADAFRIGSAISLKTSDQALAKEIALLSEMTNASSELIEKACSSGLSAVHRAAQSIWHEGADFAVGGGMDMMSQDEERTKKALTCRFSGKLMYQLADKYAEDNGISQNEHDKYAAESYRRAKKNLYGCGSFVTSIIIPGQEQFLLNFDEIPNEPAIYKLIRGCKTLTYAASSKYADGVAFIALASPRAAKKYKLKKLARFVAYAESTGSEPKAFVAEPIRAIAKVLKKAKRALTEIDLFFINEAFATTPVNFMKATGVAHEKVNPTGGAIAFGHPLGMSGAKLVIDAVCALIKQNKKSAIVSVCNAGPEATAALIEIC